MKIPLGKEFNAPLLVDLGFSLETIRDGAVKGTYTIECPPHLNFIEVAPATEDSNRLHGVFYVSYGGEHVMEGGGLTYSNHYTYVVNYHGENITKLVSDKEFQAKIASLKSSPAPTIEEKKAADGARAVSAPLPTAGLASILSGGGSTGAAAGAAVPAAGVGAGTSEPPGELKPPRLSV